MCGIFGFKGNLTNKSVLVNNFMKLKHRGPDNTRWHSIDDVFLGFHRLSIMDLSDNGNQPFVTNYLSLVCNGEIYNYKELKRKYKVTYTSDSDCEVILPMFQELGIEATCNKLDAEFVFVIYDHRTKKLLAARDPIGIRPLFWGRSFSGELAFASEAKALSFCVEIRPFPPGHYWDGERLIQYRSMVNQKEREELTFDQALSGIKERLEKAVDKRMMADADVGFLLSGGLDSSLVCAMIARPIRTFSIGSRIDGIDNEYAEKTAKHIKSIHRTIYLEDPLKYLEELIYMLETWDVTTIRASIGMYLVSKWIRNNTNIKVLLTGDVSDELFGYKYTDYAPSSVEFQNEARKRIKEVYMYDVLRADRSLAANGLEVRVPFADLDLVDFVMSIPASLKMNNYGKGKYILRKAFEGLLPKELLYREKEAFSDGVGHSVADSIKQHAEETITDKELKEAKSLYTHGTPLFKEALLYRRIFEKYYPERLIKDFWLPNKNWKNCNVVDPSARALPNYHKVS